MKNTLFLAAIMLLAATTMYAQCPGMGGPAGGGCENQEVRIIRKQMGPGMEPMAPGMGRRGPKGPGMGQWWENPEAVKLLGLTEDKVNQIDDLALEHRKKLIDLRAKLEVARLELQDMIESNKSDGDIRGQQEKVSKAQTEIQKSRIDLLLKIRALLDKDQQQKLKGMRARMRQGMMDCCPMGPGQDSDK